jgi:ElaB/YqjD/DUF883 family membrane-anchored ribosome-binding protein
MNTQNFSKDADKKMNGAANGAARSATDAVETVSENLNKFSHEAGKTVGNFASRITDGANDYVDTSRSYIKDNPLQSAAIAAAAGLAVGCLLTLAARRSQ